MEALKEELKSKIIEVLNLEDVAVADINDDDSLFGDGLKLQCLWWGISVGWLKQGHGGAPNLPSDREPKVLRCHT